MKPKNIIVIILDGVRQDRLSVSRELINIASEGVYFSNMITASPYTSASLNSMFTGMYGSKNGVDGYYNMFKLKEDCKTLMEYLKDQGYKTIANVLNKNIVPRGFDKVYEHDEYNDDILETHKSLISELSEDEDPFFLLLQYSFVHTSLIKNVVDIYDDFSEDFFKNSEQCKLRYNSEVVKAGEYSILLLNHIKEKLNLENTISIFASDHGQSNGEKIGERAYGVYTYNYTIRVFCILLGKPFPPNKEIKRLTKTIDLMPTLMEFLGISEEKGGLRMEGNSLVPLINTNFLNFSNLYRKFKYPKFAYSETGGLTGPWPSPEKPNVRCVLTEKWKLIHNETPDTWELYDLENDSSENKNLISKNLRIKNVLMEKMKAISRK